MVASIVPSSGTVIWIVGQNFQKIGLELLVGPVDLVDQEHRRVRLADRLEQRPAQEIGLGEDVVLDLRQAPTRRARAP